MIFAIFGAILLFLPAPASLLQQDPLWKIHLIGVGVLIIFGFLTIACLKKLFSKETYIEITSEYIKISNYMALKWDDITGVSEIFLNAWLILEVENTFKKYKDYDLYFKKYEPTLFQHFFLI